MRVTPTSPTIGAEIADTDLNELSDDAFAQIYQAFIDHGVIFFRDQHLTPDQHIAFAKRWGDINVNRFFTPVADHPQIAEVRKEADQKGNIGGAWHTDHSYDQAPALGSILYAKDVPTLGGDTLFASQYAAFDGLSAAMQTTILDLWADHTSRIAFGTVTQQGRIGNPEAATQDAVHPVVIEHPLSGRSALYVNRAFTTGFHGWTEAESAPLLEWLYAHCSQPRYTTRFSWEPGSMAIWDNRAVQHNALDDYDGHRRLMHRITVDGVKIEPARPQARPA